MWLWQDLLCTIHYLYVPYIQHKGCWMEWQTCAYIFIQYNKSMSFVNHLWSPWTYKQCVNTCSFISFNLGLKCMQFKCAKLIIHWLISQLHHKILTPCIYNINNLLIKSEGCTGKYQTEVLKIFIIWHMCVSKWGQMTYTNKPNYSGRH